MSLSLTLVTIVTLLCTKMASGHVCPHRCTCSNRNLNIDCTGLAMTTLPFITASTLTLNLSKNSLGPVIRSVLPQMTNLTDLDLSHNGLTQIVSCTFRGLAGLRRVQLQHNQLTNLTDCLFSDSQELEYLDLSHNRLTQLPDGVFKDLPALRYLDLSHNNIQQLLMGAGFQVLRILEQLDLSYNHFSSLTNASLAAASDWSSSVPRRSLTLAFCRLSDIQAGGLSAVPRLSDIDLSGNTELSPTGLAAMLKGLRHPSSLQTLTLTHMGLSALDDVFLEQTFAHQLLNVSYNNIRELPSAVFSSLQDWTRLDVSHNQLEALPEGISGLASLSMLNISHNRLSSFTTSQTTHLDKLEQLDVSHNRLTELALTGLTQLRELRAGSNRLRSLALSNGTRQFRYLDCRDNQLTHVPSQLRYSQVESLDLSGNQLTALGRNVLKDGTAMKAANLSGNQISAIDSQAFPGQSPLLLDLSNNSLSSFNASSWAATQRLLLHHNRLAAIGVFGFKGMSSLDHLDLSHNKMAALHEDLLHNNMNLRSLDLSHNQLDMAPWGLLFRNLENLETLDLSANLITFLNVSMLDHVTRLQSLSLSNNRLKTVLPSVFRPAKLMTRLDLSHNPFYCSCDMMAFRDWLRRTPIIVVGLNSNSSAYVCQNPPERAGVHVTSWDPREFECNRQMMYVIIFSSIGVFLLVVAVVASTAYRFVMRRRRARPAWRKNLQVKLEKDWGHSRGKQDFVAEILESHDRNGRKYEVPDRTHEYRGALRPSEQARMERGYRKEGEQRYSRMDPAYRRRPSDHAHSWVGQGRLARPGHAERAERDGRRESDYVNVGVYPRHVTGPIVLGDYPPERRRTQERGQYYRPPYAPAILPGHWDYQETWGGPRGFDRPRRSDYYYTLPARGSEGREMRSADYQQEVHFEEFPKRPSRMSGDLGIPRSKSSSLLPQELADDLSKREQAGSEPYQHKKAISQPFLPSSGASDWL
ncbi:slit homolog 2 protein-like [Physella acuta]|uniref:slit homolog 2 protein-like n=1 Tax=Physella acuta TaxID=109671 RepID=UPI0027DAEA5B|nr:slit homolog 2 protein-like [Physella acuta]